MATVEMLGTCEMLTKMLDIYLCGKEDCNTPQDPHKHVHHLEVNSYLDMRVIADGA